MSVYLRHDCILRTFKLISKDLPKPHSFTTLTLNSTFSLSDNFLKSIFYKKKLCGLLHLFFISWRRDEEEIKKFRIIWADCLKKVEEKQSLINKALSGLNKLEKGQESSVVEKDALMKVIKDRKPWFSDNREELENPSSEDVLSMDKITLGELSESAKDSRKLGEKKFDELMVSYNKIISQSRSNQTPTEFIAELSSESSFDIFDDS